MHRRYRPRHPKTDLNHGLVRAVGERLGWRYRGHVLYALDVSKLGGECVDWIVWLGAEVVAVEIKQPSERGDLTEGEQDFFAHCPGRKAVVTDEQEFVDVLDTIANEIERRQNVHQRTK